MAMGIMTGIREAGRKDPFSAAVRPGRVDVLKVWFDWQKPVKLKAISSLYSEVISIMGLKRRGSRKKWFSPGERGPKRAGRRQLQPS